MDSVTARDAEPTRCEFFSGESRCRGWFYTPAGDPPYACVVLAHGFGASPDGLLGRIAVKLNEAGLAAFTFDFRHFGASEGRPRLVLSIARQLQDWAAAVEYVRAGEP